MENIIDEKTVAQKKDSLKVEVEALRSKTRDKGGGMYKEPSVDVKSSKHFGKPETINRAEDKKETSASNADVLTHRNNEIIN